MPLHSTALRYFIAVARARSISGAAEAVHVVPSAISRQVQRLEESIGCALFDRGTRGVALTKAGTRLFAWAVEQQEHADLLMQELRGFDGQRMAAIRVACTDGFTTGFMSNVIAGFRKRHQEVMIHLAVGTPSEVTHWLQRGEVDCGLKFGLELERDINLIYTDWAPVRAVVSPKHPLTALASVQLKQLVDHPLALPGADTTIHQALNMACNAENLRYQAQYSGNLATLLSLAVLGEAIVLASDYATRGFVQAGSLKALAIRNPLLEHRRVMLLSPSGQSLSRPAEAFVSDILRDMRSYSVATERL